MGRWMPRIRLAPARRHVLVVPVLVDYADASLAGYGAAQGVFGALLLPPLRFRAPAGYADGDDGRLLAGAAAGGGLRAKV